MFRIHTSDMKNTLLPLIISSIFVLSVFLLPICILSTWESIRKRVKEYILILIITTFILIQIFTLLDIFLFYIFFEAILIPMFLLIGIWGSREEIVERDTARLLRASLQRGGLAGRYGLK